MGMAKRVAAAGGLARLGDAEQAASGVCIACRETRLSRYNKDPVCSGCMRSFDAGIAEENSFDLSWLWDSLPMRRALARADIPAAVMIFRMASGLSQQRLAEMLHMSQSAVGLIESGKRDTLYDIRNLLAFADSVKMPRTALLPLVLSDVAVITETEIPL